MATPLFGRILVPHDFSAHATRALHVAASLAREHGGTLSVVHVLVPFYVPSELPLGLGRPQLPPIRSLVPDQLRRLHDIVERELGAAAADVPCRVLVGDPAERIVRAGRAADCIVMATAGRTGLAHLLVGSVTEKVVRHATVPVLVLRADHRPVRAKPATRRARVSRPARA